MSRAAFTGGRNFGVDFETLDALRVKHKITSVIVGDAKGCDACVYAWARNRRIAVSRFVADWTGYGNMAGEMRNEVMIRQKPDRLFAFIGGTGTDDMMERADAHHVPIERVL